MPDILGDLFAFAGAPGDFLGIGRGFAAHSGIVAGDSGTGRVHFQATVQPAFAAAAVFHHHAVADFSGISAGAVLELSTHDHGTADAVRDIDVQKVLYLAARAEKHFCQRICLAVVIAEGRNPQRLFHFLTNGEIADARKGSLYPHSFFGICQAGNGDAAGTGRFPGFCNQRTRGDQGLLEDTTLAQDRPNAALFGKHVPARSMRPTIYFEPPMSRHK